MTSAIASPRLDVDEIRERARGNWRSILGSLGLILPATAMKHGPCPSCGGKDRFRFDDKDGLGSWYCNQCEPRAGDGFALIMNVFSCDFAHALETVSLELGHSPLNGTSKQERRIVATYDYIDNAGELCFQVVRFEPKDFRQRRPDGQGGWIWNLDDVRRPLYRLPNIIGQPDDPIVFHEGEKAVEAATTSGLPGCHTTTVGGARAPRKTDFSILNGRRVIICPDHDTDGEKYLCDVAAMAHEAGAISVNVLRLPGRPVKGDVVEWIRGGGTAGLFAELLGKAEPIPPGSVSALSVPISDIWPEIQPVMTELQPVEPLPLSIVPVPFQSWIADVSNRMQCPPDFVAAAMLVMAGAIVGAGCGIRPKKYDDWTVVPNFWGGVVGRPSMLKTPAIGEAMKPLDRLECMAKQAYDTAKKNYDAEYEAYKARRESLQTDMRKAAKGKAEQSMDDLKVTFVDLKEPDAIVWRRYKTNDATIEKMAELQKDNPRGLLLFRDELIGLFATWDKDGHEADRAFYLESWNGVRPYTSDRIGRGTVFIENLCVSLFGGIQPTKLTGYLHQAMRGCNNDGLVQRLQILVYPDEPRTWQLIDTPVNAQAKEQAYRVVERLVSMDFRQHGAFGDENQRIPYYRFDDQAQAIFNDWLTALETKLRQDHDEPVLIEHLGKYRSLLRSQQLGQRLSVRSAIKQGLFA